MSSSVVPALLSTCWILRCPPAHLSTRWIPRCPPAHLSTRWIPRCPPSLFLHTWAHVGYLDVLLHTWAHVGYLDVLLRCYCNHNFAAIIAWPGMSTKARLTTFPEIVLKTCLWIDKSCMILYIMETWIDHPSCLVLSICLPFIGT